MLWCPELPTASSGDGPFSGMSLKQMQAALAAMSPEEIQALSPEDIKAAMATLSPDEITAALANLSPEERAALSEAAGGPPKTDPKSCFNGCQEEGGSETECACACIPGEKDSPRCSGKSGNEGQPPSKGPEKKHVSNKPSNQNLSCDTPADENIDMSPVTGPCDGGCLIQYPGKTMCYYRGDENAEVACDENDMLWCPELPTASAGDGPFSGMSLKEMRAALAAMSPEEIQALSPEDIKAALATL